jgi:hypothetical protein
MPGTTAMPRTGYMHGSGGSNSGGYHFDINGIICSRCLLGKFFLKVFILI